MGPLKSLKRPSKVKSLNQIALFKGGHEKWGKSSNAGFGCQSSDFIEKWPSSWKHQDNVRQTSTIGRTGPERSAQKPFHRKKRASETDAAFIDKKHKKCLTCGSRHDHPGALGSPLRLLWPWSTVRFSTKLSFEWVLGDGGILHTRLFKLRYGIRRST